MDRRQKLMETYKEIRDENGQAIKGRTHLFVTECDTDGSIINSQSGVNIVPEVAGTLFVVDDWLIPQIDKLMFVDGTLVIKEVEMIEEQVKSDADLQEEELLRQLDRKSVV